MIKRFAKLAVITFCMLIGAPQSLHAFTFLTVTTTEDLPPDGSCDANSCTLREAIIASNTNLLTGNVIVLPDLNPDGPEVYRLTRAGDDDLADIGDLDILDDLGGTDIKRVTIQGLGADQSIIDAGGLDRAFHVMAVNADQTPALLSLSLNDLTIRGGRTDLDGAAIFFDAEGSLPGHSLAINNCHLTDNVTSNGSGGAIFARTSQPQNASSLISLVINNSTFSDNHANSEEVGGQGGAIFGLNVSMKLSNSTLSGNSAGLFGGAIQLTSIDFETNHLITSSTIVNNSSPGTGGGIYLSIVANASIANTILAGNDAGFGSADCSSSTLNISNGFNIFGDVADCNIGINNDQTNVDAASILDTTLRDNGGPTPTHALLEAGIAVNGANPAGCFNGTGLPDDPENLALTTDQRLNIPRIVDGRCDVGAYEFVPATDVSVVKTANVPSVNVGDQISYTLKVTNEGDADALGVVLSDKLPAELTFVSVNPADPTCSFSSGVVTCKLDNLPAGASFVATVVAKVDSKPANGNLVNTANVEHGGTDTNPDNNSSSVTTAVSSIQPGTFSVEGGGFRAFDCSLNPEASPKTWSFALLSFVLLATGISWLRHRVND